MFRALGKVGLALFCILGAGVALANPLEVSIEPGGKPGVVQVSLTNTSTNPVSVLRWDTPFEDTLSHPVFIIQSPTKGFPYNATAKYTGRVVKRSAASEDSYMQIDSGETVSASVALNEYYDVEQFGLYGVQFFGDIRYKELGVVTGRSKLGPQDVDALEYTHMHSNTMTMALQPNLTPRLRPPEYASCSVQQQADIVEAANIAETLTQTALTDLRSLTAAERASSPRYNTWFGAYDETRYNRVISNFESIQNAMADETLQFNCNCNEAGIYAFVYPAFPYSITLCPEFRNAPPNGENSRAGTIIHEISHFTVVADTDDHAYSHQGTQALAISSPNLAVANADSHEYFAENDPALPIRRANDDPNPPQFSQLQLGTPVQSSVAAGERNTYQVTNATRIALESLSGDADLYVYSDDQLSVEICRSRQQSALDTCEIFNNSTVYVQVAGFNAATYSIVATNNNPVTNDTGITLTLGTPVNGSVAQSQQVIYQVTGASVVDLQSLTGDADLYVFNSSVFSTESLVCSSVNTAPGVALDRCNVPTSGTYYIAAYGFSSSTYSIVARSNTSTTNIVRLTLGQPVTGALQQGEFDYFVVSGASSVVLTSATGDADLLVTNDSNFIQNDASCVSDEFSSDSTVDQCAVPNTADHYVLVRGYTNATYSIVANGNVPSNDDPTTSTSSGGGGGALGLFALLSLMLSLSMRARVRG